MYRQKQEDADIQFKGNFASSHSFTEEQTETPSELHLKETHGAAAPSVSLGHGWPCLENCFATF